MTTLYLVRHAIAAEPGPAYPADEARPLTDDGVERFRQQVRGLRELDVAPEAILTSPYLRCRQTAQLLSEGLDGAAAVDVLDGLRPGGRVGDVLDALGDRRKHGSLALVGHEPSIGHLAAALMGAHGSIPFKKGAVCRIDVAALPPRGAGTLVWLLPPRVLRRLGE